MNQLSILSATCPLKIIVMSIFTIYYIFVVYNGHSCFLKMSAVNC